LPGGGGGGIGAHKKNRSLPASALLETASAKVNIEQSYDLYSCLENQDIEEKSIYTHLYYSTAAGPGKDFLPGIRRLGSRGPGRLGAAIPRSERGAGGSSVLLKAGGRDAVDVDQGLRTVVLDVMEGSGGDIGHFSGSDGKLLIITNVDLPLAGEKDEEFFILFGAVLSAGFSGFEEDAARFHTVGLGFAGQQSLESRLVVEFDGKCLW
jgi:hypothetical protein